MKIKIIETLAVTIEAESVEEARAMYDRAEVVLSADDFEGVEFYPEGDNND